MSIDEMMKQVATTLEKEGNAKTIFAQPVKLESHTVIPVAAVNFAAAAAGSGMPGAGKLARFLGGGGGGGIDVKPVGFIHESGTEVVFTPIHIDAKGKPFATEGASAIGRVMGVLTSMLTGTH
ncbi:MAG: hypothetical protein JST54_28395 [Deltaproteobacteria bacterium]|nr:hypothetical protein [Deltaproteobacteria bacterium]